MTRVLWAFVALNVAGAAANIAADSALNDAVAMVNVAAACYIAYVAGVTR